MNGFESFRNYQCVFLYYTYFIYLFITNISDYYLIIYHTLSKLIFGVLIIRDIFYSNLEIYTFTKNILK